MACHLSIFAAFLLVSTTTSVSAKMATCTIGQYGILTMFNNETASVKIPCKYRMADFECSGYKVKVTPGSVLDGADQFSPDTVWVKITSTSSGDYYVGRTSGSRIDNHISDSTFPVWERKGGILQLDKEDYLSGQQYARLLITGKVKVQFATSGDQQGVKVKCTYANDADFVSEDYPTSLCGNKHNTSVISSRKTTLFNDPSVNDDLVIAYDVFDHASVVQSSKECEDAAKDFRTCQNPQTESIQTCGPIFTDPTLAGCLINNDNKIGRFQDCVKLACNNNMATCQTKLDKFKGYVDDKCSANTYADAFSALSCS